MQIQELLDALTAQTVQPTIFSTEEFIAFLRSDQILASPDPFTRLVRAALYAGTQANATIAGHQAAIRRLFPTTPNDAVTAFCVSEDRGPHPRFIKTRLEGDNGKMRITGQKMWGTMAPAADLLYVAASIGEVDGLNQLKMVGIETNDPSITQIPLPPERQAGDVPICDLRFEATPVHNNHVFDGDAYNAHIKPFRLIEDVFSTAGMQVALWRLGTRLALSHSQREDLFGLIIQGHAVAESSMEKPGDILLITSYLRASQDYWQSIASTWNNANSDVRGHWRGDRKILTVAERARAQRRANAWQELGETLAAEAD